MNFFSPRCKKYLWYHNCIQYLIKARRVSLCTNWEEVKPCSVSWKRKWSSGYISFQGEDNSSVVRVDVTARGKKGGRDRIHFKKVLVKRKKNKVKLVRAGRGESICKAYQRRQKLLLTIRKASQSYICLVFADRPVGIHIWQQEIWNAAVYCSWWPVWW